MTKQDKDWTSGPPRGSGRYTGDGHWWWDDRRQRWFRTTGEVDVLGVEVEDVGSTSLVSSLLTTLGTQHGVVYHRFVGRAHSGDARWPAYTVVGATFPVMRAPLDDLQAHGAWAGTIEDRLGELRQRLAGEGWRPAGKGAQGGPTATPALALIGIRHRTPTTADCGHATVRELFRPPVAEPAQGRCWPVTTPATISTTSGSARSRVSERRSPSATELAATLTSTIEGTAP